MTTEPATSYAKAPNSPVMTAQRSRSHRIQYAVIFGTLCAVKRRLLLAGANPAQQLSLRLEAARADQGGNDMV